MSETRAQSNNHTHEPSRLPQLVRLVRPLIGLAILIAVVVLINPAGFTAELDDWREWIDGLGLLGVGLFLIACVVASILLVPVALIKIAAGGLYGGVLGVVIASVGGTLGATACMILSRSVLHDATAQWLRDRPWHRRLTRLVQRRGPFVVAGVRMIPILPGNLLNYAMGLVRIDVPRYMLWTWIGSLPSTIVVVVGTDALVRSLIERNVTWAPILVAAGAMLLIVALSMWIGRMLQDDPTGNASDMTDAAALATDSPTPSAENDSAANAGWSTATDRAPRAPRS